ncbi:MAG TPA: Na+/H+ antiporter subunit E [Chiayiivirga sp.]|nr:Na+/H+ antiporter subunit E [Chiayiivirga sp.]
MFGDRESACGAPGRTHRAGAWATRFALLAALWWVVTEGTGGWGFGVPLAALVATASLWLTPPTRHRLRLLHIAPFIGWFLVQSVIAGWDVARRILHPALPLRPAVLRLPLALPEGAPTWWLMLTLSLLPGTLSVQLEGRTLELHCLDEGIDVAASVDAAQRRLARLFGHEPTTRTEPR